MQQKKNRWTHLPPREKLLLRGAASLTDTELLAIFLRTGLPGLHVMQLAARLLEHFGSLHRLMGADEAAFQAIKGVGTAKFVQFQAIAELARRAFSSRLRHEKVMLSPEMTTEFLQGVLAYREREVFVVIFLDNQHYVLHHSEMFSGGLVSVEIYPREIVREALKLNAAAIILAHNHPSGKAEPSEADKQVTQQIIDACELLDIRVLDHLVIGRGDYVSFAERGWL